MADLAMEGCVACCIFGGLVFAGFMIGFIVGPIAFGCTDCCKCDTKPAVTNNSSSELMEIFGINAPPKFDFEDIKTYSIMNNFTIMGDPFITSCVYPHQCSKIVSEWEKTKEKENVWVCFRNYKVK